MSFAVNSIPERMLQRLKGIDNHYSKEEKLYVRCLSDHIVGGMLTQEGIRFPNFSVNREKYSELRDVLIPVYLDWGIAGFQVEDLPAILMSGEGTTIHIRPAHDPLPANYSHSEIRSYGSDTTSITVKPSRKVQKEFRARLAQRTRIIKHSDISSQEWEAVKADRVELRDKLESSAIASS